MPDFSTYSGGNRFEHVGPDTSDSLGTDVTGDTTANTKGSWVELDASTAFPVAGCKVYAGPEQTMDYLLDIGVGAAGSEVVLIPDLYVSGKLSAVQNIDLPISIAAGTRIAARCQADAASQVVTVSLLLMGNPFLAGAALGGRVTAYGANTADSGGTSVDPGGTAHTKGSWTEIVASTDHPIKALIMAVGAGGNFARANEDHLFDVAVGAAGSEQVLLENLRVMQSGGLDSFLPTWVGPFPVNIPEGSRLAVRQQSSSTDASDRLADVVLYGVD